MSCEMQRECARDHYQVDKARAVRNEDRMTDYSNCPGIREKCGLAFFYQGNCFLRLNKQVEALVAFQESIRTDPSSNAACYNNLGVTYAFQGEFGEARKCFQKALDLKTGYLDAQFNLQNSIENWRITWRELRSVLLPYS